MVVVDILFKRADPRLAGGVLSPPSMALAGAPFQPFARARLVGSNPTLSGRSATLFACLRAEAAWPTDPHQSSVRVGQGKLVHAPRLMFRASAARQVGHAAGKPIHIFQVKVNSVRISTANYPTFGSLGR